MSCEICGRGSCCSSFHSIEEQQSFDDVADKVKGRMFRAISGQISRIDGHYHGDNYYVKLDDVQRILDDYS